MTWKEGKSRQLPGSVQSLEFLKKSWNFPSTFLDLEKVWKVERMSGKMIKSVRFFFSKLAQVLHKWLYFSFWSNRIHSRPYVCSASREKRCFYFFKVCIDHLFDNLESGKKIIVLEKSLEKVLNFRSKNLCEPWVSYGEEARPLEVQHFSKSSSTLLFLSKMITSAEEVADRWVDFLLAIDW